MADRLEVELTKGKAKITTVDFKTIIATAYTTTPAGIYIIGLWFDTPGYPKPTEDGASKMIFLPYYQIRSIVMDIKPSMPTPTSSE